MMEHLYQPTASADDPFVFLLVIVIISFGYYMLLSFVEPSTVVGPPRHAENMSRVLPQLNACTEKYACYNKYKNVLASNSNAKTAEQNTLGTSSVKCSLTSNSNAKCA